jgi:hypothetical protein
MQVQHMPGGGGELNRKKFAQTTTRTGTVYIASALVLATYIPASTHVQRRAICTLILLLLPVIKVGKVTRISFYINQQCKKFFLILTIFILSLLHISIHFFFLRELQSCTSLKLRSLYIVHC